jgi:hypothetical protein
MKNSDNIKKLSDKPKLRINFKNSDLRKGPKDRRKIHTYIANDRRSGVADRRRS